MDQAAKGGPGEREWLAGALGDAAWAGCPEFGQFRYFRLSHGGKA